MKLKIIFLAIFCCCLLAAYALWRLNVPVKGEHDNEEWKVNETEFAWINADSLSLWINKIYGDEVNVVMSGGKMKLEYESRKYLFHEETNGAASTLLHMNEVYPSMISDSQNGNVIITLHMRDNFVECPTLIIAEILARRSRYQ